MTGRQPTGRGNIRAPQSAADNPRGCINSERIEHPIGSSQKLTENWSRDRSPVIETFVNSLAGGSMQPRISLQAAPGGYHAMLGLEKYLHECGLEEPLILLIKVRASQINGCAYCIDMHWKDARTLGEAEQRLYGLDAWRESPYYTERERAALAWTDAVTLVADGHVPDSVYEEVKPHFTEKELADLTLAVATINAWNRLAIASRAEAGKYQPAKRQEAAKKIA
jgi:AhpD family alkylhydroperoxidase